MKYSFKNDYSEGAHPNILKALTETNSTQEIGYGEDTSSLEAAEMIRKSLRSPKSDIHFVSGGTQANIIALASMMRPYESVLAAWTAHINMHEAGGIEATGHKINTLETKDGKLRPEMMEDMVKLHFSDEHMDKPRVVFISNPTEIGTHYTKEELVELRRFCTENKLLLYLDGARIGSALMVENADVAFPDIAELTDMFYIGGTKNGALLGEALVVNNDELKPEFLRHIKQRGALLAKGRVLGMQFRELFRDNLYLELAKHANDMAQKMSKEIHDLGYEFLTDSSTNQIFPIFPENMINKLEKDYGFYVWKRLKSEKVTEQTSAIRLVTSWATPEDAVEGFLEDLKQLG